MNAEKKFLGFSGYIYDRYDDVRHMVQNIGKYSKIEKFFILQCLDICSGGDGDFDENRIYMSDIDEKHLDTQLISNEENELYDMDIYLRKFTRYTTNGSYEFVYDFYGYPGYHQGGFIVSGSITGNIITIDSKYMNTDSNLYHDHRIAPEDASEGELMEIYSILRTDDKILELIAMLSYIKVPWCIIGMVVSYCKLEHPGNIEKFFTQVKK